MLKHRSPIVAGLFLLIAVSATSALVAQGPTPPSPAAASVQRPAGGLQIDVQPRRALVFVDGMPMGRVDQYSGYYKHLTLPAGYHFVEILESGYWPVAFNITIVPDRTLKYRAELQEASKDVLTFF